MTRLLIASLIAALAVQLWLGEAIRGIPDPWDIVPAPPTDRSVAMASFGDEQFLHRAYALQVQNFGDTGGRTTRMADYDMSQVVPWLELLDRLDSRAQFQLALAMGYFASTPNASGREDLVQFVSRAVTLNPVNRAQWLREAIVIADRRIKNPVLAIKLADQLANTKWSEMNILAYQLAPLLRAKYGDYAGAAAGMKRALEKATPDTPPQELIFMAQFIAESEQKAGLQHSLESAPHK